MEDILIDLFGGLAVEGTQDIICPVGSGGNKAVIPQLMINIFLISFHPAVLIVNQGIGHSVLIDAAVGGDAALVTGTAHKGDSPLTEGRIDGCQHAGVVAGTEVNAHSIPVGPAHRLQILLHALYVLHRHGRGVFQHIGGGADPIGKSDDAHSIFHYAGLIAHTDTANTGHAGEPFLQLRHVPLELLFVG